MASTLTRAEAEALLYREARLLDTRQLDEWQTLFAEDGVYWIPIDETKPISENASLIYDSPARRDERVYHLLHTVFPAQTPPSRLLHFINNVEVEGRGDSEAVIHSNQIIYETRLGDFSQYGLGELRPIVASMRHEMRLVDGAWKIALKQILLINREMPQGNLTFII